MSWLLVFKAVLFLKGLWGMPFCLLLKLFEISFRAICMFLDQLFRSDKSWICAFLKSLLVNHELIMTFLVVKEINIVIIDCYP